MTDADLLSELYNDVIEWRRTRKIANLVIALCIFTTLVSAMNIYNPIAISPFQHILTGLILGASQIRQRLWDRSIRSLWFLQALDLSKASIARIDPFYDGDRSFIQEFSSTISKISPMKRDTYEAHVKAAMQHLQSVSPAVKPLLAAHIALIAHAAPRKRWLSRRA